jgi:DNA polymerase-3 subunit epsilon
MAVALEQHPDYKVLRRLKPCMHFPAAAQGPCATMLLLDSETTGLEASRERIIELALLRVQVDLSTGQPVGEVQVYDGFEDPGRPIPPAITQLTGITDAQVRGQRLNEGEVARLLDGVDVVIAHNAGFDRPFVETRLPAFAHAAWACSWADVDWKSAGHSSAKLEHLVATLGWFYEAHRAEADCHALLNVLAQALPTSTTGTYLNSLWAAAQQTHHKLYATGAPFESKDVLKARGYRWDGLQKVWLQILRSDAELEAELSWLADAVYLGQAARVRVETLDARHRYSTRAGVVNVRLVGAGALL